MKGSPIFFLPTTLQVVQVQEDKWETVLLEALLHEMQTQRQEIYKHFVDSLKEHSVAGTSSERPACLRRTVLRSLPEGHRITQPVSVWAVCDQ